MQFQWYPGHMARTMRQIKEDIRLVDLVIEIADARIPLASRNPDLDTLAQGKARIAVYGKADLADPAENERWLALFKSQGRQTLFGDFRNGKAAADVKPLIREATRNKAERDKRLGMRPRPVRVMVCGIPNAGKSTFINSFAGTSAAKTGNRPGVTKGKQWIRIGSGVELLDTAGVLWPKFDDTDTGKLLAMTGSMPDTIVDTGELALSLIEIIRAGYAGYIHERYGCGEEGSAVQILEGIAARRGALKKGGEVDYERAANALLEDFRAGRIGRISLEKCREAEGKTD